MNDQVMLVRYGPRIRRELKRRWREMTALLLIRLRPGLALRLRGERNWMIGSASGKLYIDNGAALHQHIRACHPDINVLYVIDDDAENVDTARAFGPTIDSRTVEAYVRGLLAEVHVITHGVHDVPACASRKSRALKVRLGHGLTALKKTRARPLHTNQTANEVFDLVPVASDFERENKRMWGIPDSKLVVTGLARFDTLVQKTRRHNGDTGLPIVYMPTWRDFLPPGEESFRDTDYYRAVAGFLDSHELHEVLKRHDTRIEFVLHRGCPPIARRVFAGLSGEFVQMTEAADPQDIFARSRALITDYSSVAWDFLFIDKPVLFYQFDRAQFGSVRGGYIDVESLPGPTAETPAEAIHSLDVLLATGMSQERRAIVSDWKEKAFSFRDADNSRRIVEAIRGRLAR